MNIKQLLEIAQEKYKNTQVKNFQGYQVKVIGEIKYNSKLKTITCLSTCLAKIDDSQVEWVSVIQ